MATPNLTATAALPLAPPAPGEVLCEIRGVNHDFLLPDKRPIRVLEDINLTLRANEVVALLGPSGCGKSTLLRIAAGIIPPTTGQVLYRGQPLRGQINPGVAVVFQSFGLYPWLTVVDNLACVLKAAGRPRDTIPKRIDEVLRLVGLTGFEEAYPRELSGGMKQRMGIARALAVDTELLFLDEPFSQVDALTGASLRADLMDIWAEKGTNPLAILIVSHDIHEVAYMADRIVLLSNKPGRIQRVIENKLPRPRDPRSPGLLQMVERLHEAITGAELPDLPETQQPVGLEVLPDISTIEICGLLEYLDAHGAKQDLFRVAGDIHQEFGHLIAIVKAAELLDLVETPKRYVMLTDIGRRFVAADPEERQALWRQQLLELRLFRNVYHILQHHPDHAIEEVEVMELLVLHMPQEDYERVFHTFIRWARFGNLFAYEEDSGIVSLQEEAPPAATPPPAEPR